MKAFVGTFGMDFSNNALKLQWLDIYNQVKQIPSIYFDGFKLLWSTKVAAMGLDPVKHLGKELTSLDSDLHKLNR